MLCVIRPKACQKCGGDLSLECDIYGVYAECIQCGATWSKDCMMSSTQKDGKQPKTSNDKSTIVVGHKR